jgi:hypothetical protein
MIYTSFPIFDCEINMGGIKSFRFIPIEMVESIDSNLHSFVFYDITLKAGKTWKDGYSTMEKALVNSVNTESPNGPLWKNELKGFYPKSRWNIEKLFAMLSMSGRFIVDYTDNNGERVLLGTLQNGVKFGYEYTTQDAVKKLHGYNFRFYHDSSLPKLTWYDSTIIGGGGGPGGS